MPPYSDFETCRHKMTQMLRLGRAHFDEGAGQLSIVVLRRCGGTNLVVF